MKKIMDTMGDLVKDNEKEKNRAAEKLYIENCIAKDKREQQQDQARKIQRKRDAQQMNNFLGSQVADKERQEKADRDANALYIANKTAQDAKLKEKLDEQERNR